ncbi:unnamed protein product [Periconia digitata]|uniref:Uncharacterized protein n=1 Tax=Periconia digitata TaxID=1303443 RepID=A0A9W4UND5_9PLEO|nr:unnamed protein product [Periconia digitata]
MSAMISQTLQGAVLSATSNVLAQAIAAYKNDTTFSLDPSPILKFALFSIISSPPNILWQSFLEDILPTNVRVAPSEKKKNATQRSTLNIFLKFLLDQTFGALFNNLMFLAFMGYTLHLSSGSSASAYEAVLAYIKTNLVPMAIDGYKFWPAVSLASFLWVPVDKRVVFGCAAGMIWGIYLGLLYG